MEKERDINVFIFPSETSILLALIIIFSLLVMFEISGSLTWILPEFSKTFTSTYLTIERWMAQLLVIPLILIAFFIYFTRPYFIKRKEGLVDLSEYYPLLASAIQDLASKGRVNVPLNLLFSPSETIDIFTLGTNREYMIVLSKGFIDKFGGRDEEFQAIIYHELSHIQLGDIIKTELALGFLLSFFILAVTYSAIGICTVIVRFIRYGPDLGAWQSVYNPGAGTSFNYITNPNLESFIPNLTMNIFTVFISGIIIWFLVRFILQYRELYADAMAARFMGSQEPLSRALIRLQTAAYFINRRRLGFFSLSRPFIVPGYHPPITRREEFLQCPDKFFVSWFSLPFTIGIVAALFLHVLARVQLIYNFPIPPDSLNLINIPVTILAVALLLPKSTARLLISPLTHLSRSHPIVVTQVFMLGFATVVVIDTNISILMQSVIQNLLYTGRDVTFNYHNVFLGMDFGAYNPVIGLIIGEKFALIVFFIMLLSGAIITILLQITGLRVLFKHPSLTLLLIPGVYAISIYLFLSKGNFWATFLLILIGIIILGILWMKYHLCPICNSGVTGFFNANLQCPQCQFDFGWWIRNPK